MINSSAPRSSPSFNILAQTFFDMYTLYLGEWMSSDISPLKILILILVTRKLWQVILLGHSKYRGTGKAKRPWVILENIERHESNNVFQPNANRGCSALQKCSHTISIYSGPTFLCTIFFKILWILCLKVYTDRLHIVEAYSTRRHTPPGV